MAGLSRKQGLTGTLCFAALQASFAVTNVRAQTPSEQTEIINKVQSALVEITGAVDGGTASGNGFIFSSDGKIATNLHVISGLNSGSVRLRNGDVYNRISVLAYDDRRDLAIIKIAGVGLPMIELGTSTELQPDESIFLFGNPGGDAASPTATFYASIVSTFREYEGFRVIQTDAAANPHNSGTPLMNLRGQAVGILGLKVPPAEHLSFAVPINYLRALLAKATANLTLDQLREALGKGPVGFQDEMAGPIPRFWKSASAPTRYAVGIDGDRIYAERILPDVQRVKVFSFRRIEAQRSGKLYVGKVYYAGTCGTVSCPFEDQAEFTLVTPNRIEGAALLYPAGEVMDCQPCQVFKAKQIIKFVWTPE